MKTETVKVKRPAFEDDPPNIPDGASRWERQELRRLWHNIFHEGADALSRIVGLLNDAADGKVTTSTSSWNNAAGDLTDAATNAFAYATLINAIHHRLALAETPGML